MNIKTLVKNFGLLLFLILFLALISKTLFHSSDTLSEYAQKNPELAYPNTNETEPAEEPPAVPEESEPMKEMPIHPERITYQDAFYYEPLTDAVKEIITGTSYPQDCSVPYEDLRYVHVLHYDFEGEIQEGELICNKAITEDLVSIFYELYLAQYQIEQIRLIDAYEGDDLLSMTDNNTSCFNYRTVEGTTKLSKHAYGLAIDINPLFNPYIEYNKDGSLHVSPLEGEPYVNREQDFPYKIDESDLCYKLFTEHGFIWGGNWNSCKDYQHFQKTIE